MTSETPPTSSVAALLDRPVQGTNLDGETLRALIGGRRTLFVFLRHFG